MEARGSLLSDAGPVDPTLVPNWDDQLFGFSGSTIFHGAGWARVLRDTYGFALRYWVCGGREKMTGIFPMTVATSRLTGKKGVCLPFTDECGPLGNNASEVQRLWEAITREGAEEGWRYLEVRGASGLESERDSQAFLGHRLTLTGPVTDLLKRFADPVRRAIKKSEKSGLEIEHSTTIEAVRIFYSLHCRTRRRHGVPPQPFGFFANIHRHVVEQNLGFVTVARQGTAPVAASVFLRWGKRAIYKFGASDERMQHLRGNNAVMWEGIQHLARLGCEELSFGRTSPGEDGLRRFKLGWGTEEYSIRYRRYDYRTRAFTTASDRSTGLHTKVFGALPIPILRFCGERLYPHLV